MIRRADAWEQVIDGELEDWQACVDAAREVLASPFVDSADLRIAILSLQTALLHGEHIEQLRLAEAPYG